MENMEYANAYTEVIEILKYISEVEYNKIPKNKINLFKTNYQNYIFLAYFFQFASYHYSALLLFFLFVFQ